jgi:pimeloyl-ACP methyl ester carboxylesterase
MIAPNTTKIRIGDLSINEAVIGEGLPVLMLHGWGVNIELLWPLGSRLAPLGYRVWMLDLPGFGESSEPDSPWLVTDYAQFVLNYLDHHQLDRVHLFGHSFGGRLGLILGAEHPERIDRMVLANSAGIRAPMPFPTQVRLSTYKAVRDGLKKVGLGALSEQLRKAYNARYASTDFLATSGVMRQTFVNVVNQDLRDYAARVKPSTLLLWGDQDADTPLWQGQFLEKTIPDAGLVVFNGVGHYSYLDKLSETLRVMDYFFKGS